MQQMAAAQQLNINTTGLSSIVPTLFSDISSWSNDKLAAFAAIIEAHRMQRSFSSTTNPSIASNSPLTTAPSTGTHSCYTIPEGSEEEQNEDEAKEESSVSSEADMNNSIARGIENAKKAKNEKYENRPVFCVRHVNSSNFYSLQKKINCKSTSAITPIIR